MNEADEDDEVLMREYYETNPLIGIPVSIFPDWLFKFTELQIIDGVCIRKIDSDEICNINEVLKDERLPDPSLFHLTHLICIDRPKYLLSVKERITESGSELPGFIQIENHAIVKQALLSIFLVSPIGFTVDASRGLRIKNSNDKIVYEGDGWVKGWFYEVLDINRQAIVSCGVKEEDPFDINEVQNYALLLDPYFRSGVWWQDRMAAALAHLLDAICCNSITLTFISLTAALEALVNSSKNEITHQICERVAILCGNSKAERIEIYQHVKQLYNIRSTIVHGQAHKMKGLVTWGSLLVSPKFSVVPIEELSYLIKITILTIREILKNNDLINIYESSRDQDTVSKKISEYFLNSLFI